MQPPLIDGGILAGGESTRFGRVNKAFAQYQNRALIEHVAVKIEPHVNELWISCNHELARYTELGFSLVNDINHELNGPLAGILALLRASSADYLVISPCDTPLIPHDFVSVFKKELDEQKGKQTLLAIRCGERKHPLHLCIHRSYANNIDTFLQSGSRRVMTWIEENKPYWIDLEKQSNCFVNINTPEALTRLQGKP